MIPGKPFDPATETSRRPTPEKFAHLRKWVEPVVRNIQLTSIEQIYNVTQQLEQSTSFFVSNIINRVIAQIIGKFGDGFVTIEGTEAGALHVHIAEAAGAALLKVELQTGTASVGKILIEGNSQDTVTRKIDDTDGGNCFTVAGEGGKQIKVTMIALTVDGETSIALLTAATPLSGPMDFGGTGEPRGMVANFGNFPLVCVVGEAFNITSSDAVQVAGYVVYYIE
jgi:hypothetical protein